MPPQPPLMPTYYSDVPTSSAPGAMPLQGPQTPSQVLEGGQVFDQHFYQHHQLSYTDCWNYGQYN